MLTPGSQSGSAQTVVRRATVDDLPSLKALWMKAGLPVLEEERHLTEFQTIWDSSGALAGAAALRVLGKQGWLHSEAFLHPELEDSLRPLLWDRLRSVARNHGLARVWTREEAPFWHQQAGFVLVDEVQQKQKPPGWGDTPTGWWLLTLREESQDAIALEREFAMFAESQKASTDRVIEQARQLKKVAYVVLALALLGAVILVVRSMSGDAPWLKLLKR